ncbi:MAG: ABC transporter substrate-binding protein [Nitrospinae bacterium]|nr:ABC transporter substrate-binding protein [Nitrospinota bacterium]
MNRIFRLTGGILMVLMVAAPSWAATITYTDKMGRVVTVPVPVKRAVLFETYELSAGLGVWDRIAGISRYAHENDLMLALKPDIAKTAPSAGSGFDVNIEMLLKLRPDIVLTWTFKPETVKFMEEKGLKVIAVYPESLHELYGVMRLQGSLFGKEKKVESTIAQMEKIFALIRGRVSRIPPERRKKVIWLSGKPTTVSGGIGVNNDMFSLINGINPASSIRERSAEVSIEQIIAWNPDIIFIWGSARYGAADIIGNPQWRHVSAAKNSRVYKAPKWSTWSPRLAIVALWMAMKTYPEYFVDINLEKAADDFYREVYGIPYRKVERIEN